LADVVPFDSEAGSRSLPFLVTATHPAGLSLVIRRGYRTGHPSHRQNPVALQAENATKFLAASAMLR